MDEIMLANRFTLNVIIHQFELHLEVISCCEEGMAEPEEEPRNNKR